MNLHSTSPRTVKTDYYQIFSAFVEVKLITFIHIIHPAQLACLHLQQRLCGAGLQVPSMGIEKRKPRQLQSAVQVHRNRLQLRERHAATIASSASTPSISSGSRDRAGSVPTSCLSDGISEAEQEERLSHRSIKEGPRLIRIRVCHPRKALYSADDPTGTLVTSTSLTPIRLGGVFSDYDSNIVMSSPRDLVYFDKVPAFIQLGLLEALSTSASNPSSMAFVAINLSQLNRAPVVPFICTIDNDELSGLVLVVTNDNIRDLVKYVKSDQWGFREVSGGDLQSRQPDLYANSLKLVDNFNNLRGEGQPLDYIFVFDWDRHGEED
ncbi:hypothetical protein GGR58DRAFT_495225 [Xylaria digitata]|nr:hypothetical protein GGR58DRAFT_495225 [Xylaria digitata]